MTIYNDLMIKTKTEAIDSIRKFAKAAIAAAPSDDAIEAIHACYDFYVIAAHEHCIAIDSDEIAACIDEAATYCASSMPMSAFCEIEKIDKMMRASA